MIIPIHRKEIGENALTTGASILGLLGKIFAM